MSDAIVPVVSLQNGKPITNSRDVAELFSRLHKNVLQGIQNLECSEEFRGLNFQLTSNKVPMPRGGYRTEQSYNMTKDGFTFLAMGYTGSLAARFKEAYINRFNEMEERAYSRLSTDEKTNVRRTDVDEKMTVPQNLVLGSGRGMAQATLISEAGIYKLIAKSEKPASKAFDRWVRHDVLPAIRKTGGYLLNEEARDTANADDRAGMPLPEEFSQFFQQLNQKGNSEAAQPEISTHHR